MGIFVQASIDVDSGVAGDRCVNTFSFSTAAMTPSDAQADDVLEAVDHFYSSTPSGQSHSISYYFSPEVNSVSGLTLKAYDSTDHLSGGSLGAPIATRAGGLESPASAGPMPAHVAACLTLEGVGWSEAPVELPGPPKTRPMKRRRGRIYLGPLNQAAVQTGSLDAEPDSTFRAVVFAAAAALTAEVQAINASWDWGVWSRADGLIYSLVSVSMDDRFDVVQSRKTPSSSRARAAV